MSAQTTESLAEEFARAADMIDQLIGLQTLDDIHGEHLPRTAYDHSANSVRLTVRKDMIRNAHIGVDGDYQPLVYAGGAPLVVDEPCVILRQNPHSNNEQ